MYELGELIANREETQRPLSAVLKAGKQTFRPTAVLCFKNDSFVQPKTGWNVNKLFPGPCERKMSTEQTSKHRKRSLLVSGTTIYSLNSQGNEVELRLNVSFSIGNSKAWHQDQDQPVNRELFYCVWLSIDFVFLQSNEINTTRVFTCCNGFKNFSATTN